jgi:thioredoxin reductase (NADPH)
MEPKLNDEVARTAGAHEGPIETDAVIVGAGPVGLFQVFELGLLEIKAHIIDSLAYPGGQCIELYPDKPIYDIPAVPVCTGKELTDNLLKQIEPFGATFHLGQEVCGLSKQADGRFLVTTSKGTRLLTKTVFIAAGVGSFQPRTLKIEGLDKFLDTQLFYRVRNPATFAGKNLVIVGGGDSALDWALNFIQEGPNQAASVILMHRRDGFRAAPASVARMKELCDQLQMQFLVGQATGFEERDGRLSAIKVTGSDGVTRTVPEARSDCRLGAGHRAQADRRRHREVREQRARHLCRRRHQHLSGQEETDPVGLPRSRAGRLRSGAVHLP